MSLCHRSMIVARKAPKHDLSTCLASLVITRSISSTPIQHATPTLHPTTRTDQTKQMVTSVSNKVDATATRATPAYQEMTPLERAQRTAERARTQLQKQLEAQSGNRELGGLADNSLFAPRRDVSRTVTGTDQKPAPGDGTLSERSIQQMSVVLNPRPDARARWQRKMLIRHIQHKGRLPRQVQIDRTERSHLAKSHFFKTSMKKLAPLARQISGKSIEEAILQMRFSKKKAASEVRAHLIQARDEAIVIKGMALTPPTRNMKKKADTPVITDPATEPVGPDENPTKSIKSGIKKETDMYIAQAWVNRGPYGFQPESRARGRINILRPPWTGLSVLLKEEKTKTREKVEKEEKSIKKRTGKSMWTQLPDRPIIKQSQYVLW